MPTLIGLIVFPSFLYFIHQLTVIYFLHKLDLNQVPISFYSINCSYCNLLSCIDLHVVQRSKLFLTAGHLPAKKKKKLLKINQPKLKLEKHFFDQSHCCLQHCIFFFLLLLTTYVVCTAYPDKAQYVHPPPPS